VFEDLYELPIAWSGSLLLVTVALLRDRASVPTEL